ncbi:MAG: AMP-binding protein, partial [Alphaproteobacteria bacterium]|nr:AMP-binding protein [Alphaproteobacteria bacterium]
MRAVEMMDQRATTKDAPYKEVPYSQPDGRLKKRDDGCYIIESNYELGDYESNIVNYLNQWAEKTPDRIWMAERDPANPDADWRTITYGEGKKRVDSISQALIDRGLDETTPVMILSQNSINHALLVFGCMQIGVPASPIATAYSQLPPAFNKLHHTVELLEPKVIFAEDGKSHEKGLKSLDLGGIELVCCTNPPEGLKATPWDDLISRAPSNQVGDAYGKTGPDSVGKYLFTSGSTGMPKAVPQTQRMMCADQKALKVVIPEQPDKPSVYLDWLPWNHCYGGNSNFHGVLREGGTFYIDDGRPLPGQFEKTVRNLREISPTRYLGVAVAHALIVEQLEKDVSLRKTFFKELDYLAYGGASLPQEIWQRYQDLAVKEKGHKILFYTGWGSTETAPVASTLHWPYDGTGNIGHPLPGVTLKLVPVGTKMEVRLKGDIIFPGYYRQPDKTEAAFDEEGFYRIGDAL